MKLIRYQTHPLYTPSVSYPTLRDEMDRLFDAAFPALSSLQNGFFGNSQNDFPTDLYQGKDAFTVRAEMPGFRKEDINLEVTDGVLTLTGHRKSGNAAESQNKDGAKTTHEHRVTRSISLPEKLDLDKISATYENGVLTVTLPKREEVKPRQVAIEVK